MIRKIGIRNFRGIGSLDLALRGLNVFAVRRLGEKSNVIRTVLLVAQSVEVYECYRGMYPGYLMPRCPRMILGGGKYTSVGSFDSALHDPSREAFDFLLRGDRGELNLHMTRFALSEYVARVDGSPVTREPLRGIGFEYLFDFREAPSFCDLCGDPMAKDAFSRRQLGKAGEYTAWYLSSHRSDTVESTGVPVPDYVAARLGEMFPGGAGCVADILSRDPGLSGAGTPGGGSAEEIRTGDTYVGRTGLHYTLPVLVALAKARRGDVMVVENPEAYGYLGAGQLRRLCEAFVETSRRGVQIFLETRSAEMIRGIRDMTRSGGAARGCGDCAVFYEDGGSVEELGGLRAAGGRPGQ